MSLTIWYSLWGLVACSESKSVDSGSVEACAFTEGDNAPCILEGSMWTAPSSDGIAVFVAVNAVDPQGHLDITVEDNNFYIYDSSELLLVEDELYCEDIAEGREALRCIYSFLPFQYPDVDTNNLENYRATAIIRDWEGNESAEKELLIEEFLPY